jgi:uncharacterized protein (TIGR01777 family)
MRTVVTGATGLIGRALLRHLPARPVALSRDDKRAAGLLAGVEAFRWDPEGGPPPIEALRGADVVFHLAGEPAADGRWTAEKKRRIRDSRVVGTRALVAGLAALDKRPGVLVSASAVGYYGDRGDEMLDERSTPGQGFLAGVCVDWEREAMAAERLGVRVVCVRIGLVMSPEGGALSKMLPPFRLGAGGRLGSGRQWMPWIHIDDIVGILLHASRTEALRGPVNGVAPAPVTNAQFTLALARAVRRPALLPMPAIALHVAFGEMSEMLMASQHAMPRVALRSGFAFSHPELDEALEALLAPRARPVAA